MGLFLPAVVVAQPHPFSYETCASPRHAQSPTSGSDLQNFFAKKKANEASEKADYLELP